MTGFYFGDDYMHALFIIGSFESLQWTTSELLIKDESEESEFHAGRA